jgi:hypothetical protein
MLGKVRDAVADAAETLRRVFSDPPVREARAGSFAVRAHAGAAPAATLLPGLEPLAARALPMPLLAEAAHLRELGPFAVQLRVEEGWARWGAEATVIRMAPLNSGGAQRVAVPSLPARTPVRGGVDPVARPAARRAAEPLPSPGARRVDPALPVGGSRPGLEAMLRLAVPIQGEDIQRLPKGLWMRYSLQMVRATGENVRNLEVLGLYHLPRKGVADLRHDARRGRILVRLESEAAKAPRIPFILARRKDDGALLSCYLEEP